MATAADIPNYWSSPAAMARALATYLDDPNVIRRAVLDSFPSAPELHTIRQYRAEHLAPPKPDKPFKAYEGYYPDDVSHGLRETNARFLHALERERAISVAWAMSNGALRSPALTNPKLVDRAWETETEQALRRNTEGLDG